MQKTQFKHMRRSFGNRLLVSVGVLMALIVSMVVLFFALDGQRLWPKSIDEKNDSLRPVVAAQGDLNTDRLLWLSFEEETRDKSTSNRTIDVSGAVTYQRGATGKGVFFSNTQSVLSAGMAGLNNVFTVSMWINPADKETSTLFTLKNAVNSLEIQRNGERNITIKVDKKTIKLYGGREYAWTKFHPVGRLFNITFIYDNTGLKPKCIMYIDGTIDSENGFTGFDCPALNLTNATFVLGKQTQPAMSGLVDEVSLWKRKLSQGEIQQYITATYDHYGDGVCERGESALHSPDDCPQEQTLVGKLRETPQYHIWWADALYKPWYRERVPTREVPKATLLLAKNETRFTQVILTGKSNGSIPLSSIHLDVGSAPLTGRVSILRYIPVEMGSDNYIQPKYPNNTDPRPDAAVPIEMYEQAVGSTSIAIQTDKHVPIVLEVSTLASTPAGTYEITLVFDGQEIPVDVTVYNFTLPNEPSLPTLYHSDALEDYGLHLSVPTMHGVGSSSSHTSKQRLINAYLDVYADHNVGPYRAAEGPGLSDGFATWFDCATDTLKPQTRAYMQERLGRYLGGSAQMAATELNHIGKYYYYQQEMTFCGLKMDSYRKGTSFTLTDYSQYRAQYLNSTYEAKLRTNMQKLAEFLARNNWLDRIYFMIDEPVDPGVCGGNEYLCVFRARAFHDIVAPLGFKVGPMLPSPQYFDTIKKNQNVEGGEWFNFLAISENGLRERAQPNNEMFVSKSGVGEFWWYHTAHEAFDADSEAVSTNGLFWQMFRHDIKGSAQWAFIGWRYVGTNPWATLKDRWGGNGNIVFFYPPCGASPCSSANFNVIPSIRLKQFRESINDHAYLTLYGRDRALNDLDIDSLTNTNLTYAQRTAMLKHFRTRVAARLAGLPTPTPLPTIPRASVTPTRVPSPTLTPSRTPSPSVPVTATVTVISTPTPVTQTDSYIVDTQQFSSQPLGATQLLVGYWVIVRNTGDTMINSLALTDWVSAGLRIISVSQPEGVTVQTVTTERVGITISNLEAHSTNTIMIFALVPKGDPACPGSNTVEYPAFDGGGLAQISAIGESEQCVIQ